MAGWFDQNNPSVVGNRYNPASPRIYPQRGATTTVGGTPGIEYGGGAGQAQSPIGMPGGGIDFGGITQRGGQGSPVIGPGQPIQYTATPTTGTAPATGTGSGGVDPNNPLFQGINPQLVQYFVSHGITPTGRGSGPTDIAYLNEKMTEPGQDIGYWLNEKLPNQVFGAGGGGGGAAAMGGFGSSTAPAPFQGAMYQAPTFQAPTGLNYTNDPGYLARMQMGESAIQNAAAAKGSLLSGGTLKALERYGQDYGSNEFGNVFNRALQGFGANLGAGQWGAQFNQGVGQQGYLNRYGQFTDYLGQLNQQANRGLQSTIYGYQPVGGT